MTYTQQWSTETPGYIIFLVDQSGTMIINYNEDMNRAEYTAMVINKTINNIIYANSEGDKIKDRVYLSLLGYGGLPNDEISVLKSGYLSDFANNPLRIEKKESQYTNRRGITSTIIEETAIHIEPVALHSTPMGEAFAKAKELIIDWIDKHPNTPAPVIINITDGYPKEENTNDEPIKTHDYTKEIKEIKSKDGNPLIFNIHIESSNQLKGFEEKLHTGNNYEKLMFETSSVLPNSYIQSAAKFGLTTKFKITEKSKAYIANANPEILVNFINFGSSGGGNLA